MLSIYNTFPYRVRELQKSSSLHFLLPAGIGDCLWAMGKLKQVADQRGNVTFWLPEGEQKRAGDYLRMIGANFDYLPGLETNWVWARPGSPELPERGCISVHANLTLEEGRRIETWYPDLPLRYPALDSACADGFAEPYALLFPGSRLYMNQNLPAGQWAEIVAQLQRRFGRVRLIGAGADVEFTEEIIRAVGGGGHLLNRPFDEVAAAFMSPQCRLFLGVASGPLIAATVAGARTVMAYPRHLSRMPGTWEPDGTATPWCFVSDLPVRLTELLS